MVFISYGEIASARRAGERRVCAAGNKKQLFRWLNTAYQEHNEEFTGPKTEVHSTSYALTDNLPTWCVR